MRSSSLLLWAHLIVWIIVFLALSMVSLSGNDHNDHHDKVPLLAAHAARQVSPTIVRPTSTTLPLAESPLPLPVTTLVTVTSTPTISLPLSDEELQQEVVALRIELNRLWSATYLARAASQLADAEAALRVNDLDEVARLLITAGASLERAYERSSEQYKGPISEFRARVAKMFEELRIRPEGMDHRLRRLRQSMLSLVDDEPLTTPLR